MSKLDDKIGGTKVFEEVFIPKRPGKLTIPAVTFNYFDPKAEKYRVISTKTIAIQVHKPEGYADGSGIPYAAPNITIGSGTSDIRYIKEDLGDLKPIGQLILFNPVYLAVNSLPVLILAGAVAVRRRRKRLAADVGYARSHSALRLARKRLAKAKSIASEGTSIEFYSELSRALMSYVADRLNVSPHGLTTDLLAEFLSERSSDEKLIDDTVKFLQECDFARFAPGASSQEKIDRALHDAEEIIVMIEGINFG